MARGPILDTEELLATLDDDGLAAACLDGTEPEPLPPEHPLWSHDGVVLTPHCAGLSDKCPDRFLACFREQWSHWCAGEDVPNLISVPFI